ncbi:hypothetical protein EXIGLDRAFT_152085 [Exidia glandulosa HHB12029]|uniref:Uncharacterized protein n=1 Tax=Exidia glandulosa HHB12029 TaxID=1314781 RepID=A0A166BRS1_EXIGL|nr:hypothetical protein EXIGLDRAFT_152085 [Exidia glandulosa HHB12029]
MTSPGCNNRLVAVAYDSRKNLYLPRNRGIARDFNAQDALPRPYSALPIGGGTDDGQCGSSLAAIEPIDYDPLDRSTRCSDVTLHSHGLRVRRRQHSRRSAARSLCINESAHYAPASRTRARARARQGSATRRRTRKSSARDPTLCGKRQDRPRTRAAARNRYRTRVSRRSAMVRDDKDARSQALTPKPTQTCA